MLFNSIYFNYHLFAYSLDCVKVGQHVQGIDLRVSKTEYLNILKLFEIFFVVLRKTLAQILIIKHQGIELKKAFRNHGVLLQG